MASLLHTLILWHAPDFYPQVDMYFVCYFDQYDNALCPEVLRSDGTRGSWLPAEMFVGLVGFV